MAENNSDKTFSFYLNEIANLSEFLRAYPDGSVSDNANTIAKNVIELKKALTGIRLTLMFFSSVTLICAIIAIFSLSSSKFRSYFVDEQTALKDSLLNLDQNETSIKYREQNGKLITYKDLIQNNDSLKAKLLKAESELVLAKSDLDLCNVLLKTSKRNESFYKDNSEAYEESSSFYEDLNNKRQLEDIKDLVKRVENSKRVDSGKILLDVFRKNMNYDPKTNSWKIEVSKKK